MSPRIDLYATYLVTRLVVGLALGAMIEGARALFRRAPAAV